MESDYLFWVVYDLGKKKKGAVGKVCRRTYAEISWDNESGQLTPTSARDLDNQFEKAILSKPLVSHEIEYALNNSRLYEKS